MRWTFKRIVACAVGTAMFVTPVAAWADPSGTYCSSYAQVESNATGGSYVGGKLTYETMGNVSRSDPSTTTTVTQTGTGSVTVGAGTGTVTTTTTTTTTQAGNTTTTQEPIGFYQMNDGSIYEINCITGDSRKVS